MKEDNMSRFKKKMIHILITILMVLFMPFLLLIRLIEKIIRKNIIVFDEKKERNYVGTYMITRWLGSSYEAQNNRVFVYFLLPSLGCFLLFVILPFFIGIYYTFTNWTGVNTGSETFNGLTNFRTIFKDYGFVFSLFITTIYTILSVVIINVVAFLLALLVTQKLKLKNIFRAGFFMPNLIGGLVLGYIWQFIFNRALQTNILINANLTLFGLIIVVTWQYAGYIMMIYIAAIQNVPQDLIEASKIDGANALQRLKTITMPLVAQAFTVAMFLTLVTSFKQFDTVVSLTNGSGGTSMQLPKWIANLFGLNYQPMVSSLDLIAKNIYDQAFNATQMGIAQAKATIFFVILLVISLLQVNYNKKKEVEL